MTWGNSEIEKTLTGLSTGIMAIAEANARPVGFAAGKKNGKIWMEEGDFYFAFNYLMPDYRGKGVADILSYNIIDYGRKLGSSRIILEPVTMAGKKHAKKIGFNLLRTEEYLQEEPSKIIKEKDGIDTYVYFIDELPLTVPDHIAVMKL